MASVRLFYRLNDRDLRMPADHAFDRVASIADGSPRDVPAIAGRLRPWVAGLGAAR